MERPRCEDCGERFNNKHNLKLYRKHACEGNQESVDKTESSNETGTRKHVTSRATGTVQRFFEERGFGFVVTADVTDEDADGTEYTRDVFVHISEAHTTYIEEGDQLAFEVVETDEGSVAENVTVLERAWERDDLEVPERDPADQLGFGSQVDNKRYGRGKRAPTESAIESFKDERKFR